MSIAQSILKMLLWKGLLDVSGRRKRVMTIVTSAVAAFSLTFTQIGFVSNGLDEPFASYIIMLLMPVAASSLLLGTVWGTMLGFFAGALLYVHALFMPLDFHELIFVTPEWLLCNPDPPLGILDGFGFSSHALTCQPGDQILLYTDGVTEAMDTNNELFGDDRLMDVVRDNCTLGPQQLVETVRASVADYANGAEQPDDITMLALEVCDT